jgi:hypothetical protein
MRRALTAASLDRSHTVLAAFLAAAVALAALSLPPWGGVAADGVSSSGRSRSRCQPGVVVWKAQKEAASDRTELRRLLKDDIKPVSAVDPLTIGIDPAVSARPSDSGLPPYVPRQIDQVLSDAIVAALNGSVAWLVVIEGESKIGKSRTLFEALRAYPGANRLLLVAPNYRHAPRSILLPHEIVAISSPQVLWLDDLELFLNQGVTLNVMREWQAGRRGRIVVGTFGGKSIVDPKTGTAPRQLNSVAAEVLNSAYARRIQLEQTSAEEIAHLQADLTADEFSEVRRYGLAAYLVAGPRPSSGRSSEPSRTRPAVARWSTESRSIASSATTSDTGRTPSSRAKICWTFLGRTLSSSASWRTSVVPSSISQPLESCHLSGKICQSALPSARMRLVH